MSDIDIKSLFELHELAVRDGRGYSHRRSLVDDLRKVDGQHFTGIIGPRGVGKTVVLKQWAADDEGALYLSLDTLPRDTDVFALIRKIKADYGIDRFLLDEVHFQPGFDAVLKKLYDFLDVRVCFTSSVALALNQSAYDLSRRILLRTLHPFSLREYLLFKQGSAPPKLELEQVFNRDWTAAHLRATTHFEDYLKGGLMPFALKEPEPLAILRRILETVIQRDLPTVGRLHVDELDLVQKLVEFTGRSAVDGINYSSLAKNLGITKYKAEQYLGLLEKAFVLQRVFPGGTNVLKEPKVLMALPYRLLFRDYAEALGGLREDFFAEMMRGAGVAITYLKNVRGAKTPDYLIEDGSAGKTVIEIGGKGKGIAQFKEVTADRRFIFTHSEQSDGIRRPLHMLGFLC